MEEITGVKYYDRHTDRLIEIDDEIEKWLRLKVYEDSGLEFTDDQEWNESILDMYSIRNDQILLGEQPNLMMAVDLHLKLYEKSSNRFVSSIMFHVKMSLV